MSAKGQKRTLATSLDQLVGGACIGSHRRETRPPLSFILADRPSRSIKIVLGRARQRVFTDGLQ
jgi:hypothetical protein